jgi:drug/metabolite transporter (DMT)-like permease
MLRAAFGTSVVPHPARLDRLCASDATSTPAKDPVAAASNPRDYGWIGIQRILLLAYVGLTGNLGAVRHLSATQWQYALVMGLILLAFTITSIAGLRHASATAVIAIGAGSPIITTALVVFAGHTTVSNSTLLGLGLVLAAILVIFTLGRRQELRQARTPAPAQRKAVPA